jgi:ABC-type sugar transport system permease subunit
MWRARSAYLCIAPFFIIYICLSLGPILFSFFLSLLSWDMASPWRWVGLKNFQLLFQDDVFWTALKNTAYLWVGHVFIMLVLALLIALVLNAPWLHARSVYRAVIYLPNVGAAAAVLLVFQMMFDTTYGIFNQLLNDVGIPSVDWLGSADWTKPSVIIFTLWNVVGWYMLVFLAGLQAVDGTLYEAAAIDGANGFRKLLHVTLPGLRRIIFFCFIIDTIGSVQVFQEPWVLTSHGQPDNSAMTLGIYMYQNGITFLRLGYAAAIAVVIFAITVTASAGQALFFRGEVAE